MPDYMDHAQALQAESLDHQINAARMRLTGAAALFCEDCAAVIPEKRRAAYPSVTRCVHCQAGVEAKARHFRG